MSKREKSDNTLIINNNKLKSRGGKKGDKIKTNYLTVRRLSFKFTICKWKIHTGISVNKQNKQTNRDNAHSSILYTTEIYYKLARLPVLIICIYISAFNTSLFKGGLYLKLLPFQFVLA